MKLNLGCGTVRIPGYMGLDLRRGGAADVLGVGWSLPFKPNTFEEVFASHVLEHLVGYDLDSTIREIHRVLKPGGTLFARTPYKMSDMYNAFHFRLFDKTTYLAWAGHVPARESLQGDMLFRVREQYVSSTVGFPLWHLRHYVPSLYRRIEVKDHNVDARVRTRLWVPWGRKELTAVLEKLP